MSPSYRGNEQYERWHVRDCARCGRRAAKAANWSDGPICRSCLDRALRVRGQCPACFHHRLLPGRDEAGAAICRDCAAITRDFFCDRCGHEGLLLGGRLCQRCTLSDQLDELLDDGTGSTNPELKALRDVLLDCGRPKSRLLWLRSTQVRSLLRDLATGRIALTHDALQEQRSWRTDLDAWHAERFASRRPSRAFLLWCIDSGQMPQLHVPTRSTPSPAPLSQHRRITMLRRALTEQELPLQLRVVACLLLLYAQPVSRIVRLTTQDVTDDADGVSLRLGSPPSPVPAPLDQTIREHLQQVRSRAPASRWLFPGRRADQPAHPPTLLDQLRAAGIPAAQTRITTLRQLVLQAPHPVIAQTLGYHHTSTARVANQAGSTWSHYAPGNHDESPHRR